MPDGAGVKRSPLIRKTPLQSGGPLARSKPLAKQSPKRKREQSERRRLVEHVLRTRPRCEAGALISTTQPGFVCGGYSVDVHEPLTRARGGSIVDEYNTVSLCRRCHDWIHAHPAEALSVGLLRNSWDR